MKTIGAKEFRLHMNEIFDRVQRGEDIVVRHRFKGPVRLSAVRSPAASKSRFSGLQAFDAAAKKPSPFDPNKSVKELYRESIGKKYGTER